MVEIRASIHDDLEDVQSAAKVLQTNRLLWLRPVLLQLTTVFKIIRQAEGKHLQLSSIAELVQITA